MRRNRLTLSVEETSELLGISKAFAYDLVRRGHLPSVRLGRRVVVPMRTLMAMLDDEIVKVAE